MSGESVGEGQNFVATRIVYAFCTSVWSAMETPRKAMVANKQLRTVRSAPLRLRTQLMVRTIPRPVELLHVTI